ncbi:MAG: hypothetical protein JNM84_15035 [Planctomycetes bacterium]|nr:hypothetical protein [Planctomycetota bacterium]
MIDLFVLVIDRDGAASGNADRAARAAALQEKLVATCATEEIEAWMLAIFAPELEQSWPAIRATLKVSDSIATPFLAQRGWISGPGAGRSRATRELGKRWSAVQNLCPEIRALKSTIERAIASSGA